MALVYFLLALGIFAVGGFVGFSAGKIHERKAWHRIKEYAIAGQRLWVSGIGEVFILGYGVAEMEEDDGSISQVETVDFIPEDFLDGKWPSEIDQQVLDDNTISVPVDQFLTQVVVEEAVKKAAKGL